MSEELDLSTEVEQESIAPEEKTMDDTIRETLAEIQARGEAPEPTEEDKAPVETEEQREERLRDEKGRFVAKDAAAETPITEQAEATNAEPAEQVQPAAPSVPPELQRLGLRKEEADAFMQAPEALKQAFLRRSDEMHKGLEQFREKAQIGVAMEQAIAPFMQDIRAVGVTPDVAVRSLLASERALRHGTPEQKIHMLSKLATDYGIDIGQVTEYHASRPQVDPQVQALQSELQQMRAWVEQQNQQREWNERQTLNSTIESFAKDPANTYFESVKNDMAGLLQAGLATDLKDAYEKAIYANPTIRAQVLAKQQAEAEAKAKADAAQKAQAAKRAAVLNMPRKGVAPAAKPVGSMDDTIRETAQRLGIL